MAHCVTYVSSYCVTWHTVLDIRNILAPWQGTASWWRQERAPTVPSVQIKALHQPSCQHPTAFGQIENGHRINDLKIGRRKFYLSFLLGKSFCGIFASFLFSRIILKSLNPIFFSRFVACPKYVWMKPTCNYSACAAICVFSSPFLAWTACTADGLWTIQSSQGLSMLLDGAADCSYIRPPYAAQIQSRPIESKDITVSEDFWVRAFHYSLVLIHFNLLNCTLCNPI